MTADEIFTVAEAAQRLRVSKGVLYQAVAGGELRAIRIGGASSRRPAIRIRCSDLEAFIERSLTTTAAPVLNP